MRKVLYDLKTNYRLFQRCLGHPTTYIAVIGWYSRYVVSWEVEQAKYFRFYNHERLHQSLSYKAPDQVHLGRI